MVGMAWYALWTLVCGLAVFSTEILFIVARVLQGIGPAMTLPNAIAILGAAYSPGQKKNLAFAFFGGSAPFGAIAGFASGGLFALAWWPWAYWSAGIALVGLAGFSAWVIPGQKCQEKKLENLGVKQRLERLDLPGCAAGVISLILINVAWIQAGSVGWKQPYLYVCFIIGIIFAIVFYFIETLWAAHPILPLAAFNADIAFVLGCTACGWACFGIWVSSNFVSLSQLYDLTNQVYYAAIFVTQLNGVSPLLLAAWYSPVIPSGLISALAVGKLLGRISAALVMVIGMVAYFIGSLLIATMPTHQIYWANFFWSVLIICVGMDSSFPAATIIFSDAVPPEYQGIGASVVTTVVNYSISLGLGFASTIEYEVGRDDRERGYRGAFWFELGLAGFGLGLSCVFWGRELLRKRRDLNAV